MEKSTYVLWAKEMFLQLSKSFFADSRKIEFVRIFISKFRTNSEFVIQEVVMISVRINNINKIICLANVILFFDKSEMYTLIHNASWRIVPIAFWF